MSEIVAHQLADEVSVLRAEIERLRAEVEGLKVQLVAICGTAHLKPPRPVEYSDG
jgi:hypothetical protein